MYKYPTINNLNAHLLQFNKKAKERKYETNGYIFETKPILLEDGLYTNSYHIKFDKSLYKFSLGFSEKPRYVSSWVEGPIIAAINAGFFYFVDKQHSYIPSHYAFNFNIYENIIYGLPAFNQPAIYIDNDGDVHAKYLTPKGIIEIEGRSFPWRGYGYITSDKKYNNILYNSSCCSIVSNTSDTLFKSREVIDKSIKTPNLKEYVDICVGLDKYNKMVVTDIKKGKSVLIDKNLFVLQVHQKDFNNKIRIGSAVNIESIDDLNLKKIKHATSAGPSVFEFMHNTASSPINKLKSLGDNPPFINLRKARSIIYTTDHKYVNFRIFDSIPGSFNMVGLTPYEVFKILSQEERSIEWAYHLDPGKSAKLVINDGSAVTNFGNTFYTHEHKGQLYDSKGKGRKVPTAILAYKN